MADRDARLSETKTASMMSFKEQQLDFTDGKE
jgi:hypothetical protein